MKWQDFKQIIKADVYRNEVKVGELTRTEHGCLFEYLPEVAGQGIAFHLPTTQKRFEISGDNLLPFFAGLIPEGLRLRSLVKRIKTSESDLFSLVLAVGTDAIGDIAVVPQNEKLGESAPAVEPRRIGKIIFRELMEQSLNPKSKEFEKLETQLPGVQDKISASVISIPIKGLSRWHNFILKLNPVDKPTLVANEFFFLKMAHACGFKTAKAKLVKDSRGESGLLVERFDRKLIQKEGEPAVIKIHQEDGCQFLNRYPADKYRVSFADIATAVETWTSAPKIELLRLILLKVFCYIIANGDLHARNVSLWRPASNAHTELTPIYDVMTTLPYGDERMALKFDGRDDNIKRKHIIAFGVRFGLPEKAIQTALDLLVAKLTPRIDLVDAIGFDKRKTLQLKKIMTKRLKEITG